MDRRRNKQGFFFQRELCGCMVPNLKTPYAVASLLDSRLTTRGIPFPVLTNHGSLLYHLYPHAVLIIGCRFPDQNRLLARSASVKLLPDTMSFVLIESCSDQRVRLHSQCDTVNGLVGLADPSHDCLDDVSIVHEYGDVPILSLSDGIQLSFQDCGLGRGEGCIHIDGERGE